MSNYNELKIEGYLCSDFGLKYSQSGMPIANGRFCHNKYKKQGSKWDSEPNFFTLVAYEKTALDVEKNLHKGDRVTLYGKIYVECWYDDKAKRNRYGSKIVINRWELYEKEVPKGVE